MQEVLFKSSSNSAVLHVHCASSMALTITVFNVSRLTAFKLDIFLLF